MRSLLFGEHLETEAQGAFVPQNPWMVKVRLANTEVLALQGSMVAYQGDMEFDHKFSSIAQYFKKSFTGEGIPLMKVKGTGDLFLANSASEIHLVYLENDSLVVNGSNLLAFEPSLDWDIHMMHDITAFARGGFFNMTLTGTGWVAVTAYGRPVVLQSDGKTNVDFASAVAWSGTLKTDLHRSFNFKSLIGFGSGEALEINFKGEGVVIVQASEGRPPSAKEVLEQQKRDHPTTQ